MSYSMHLLLVMATLPSAPLDQPTPPPSLDDVLEPALQRLRQLAHDFLQQPLSPHAAATFEQQLHQEVTELGRCTTQWTFNQAEPPPAYLPMPVHFEATPYTRLGRKTPQNVATRFGTIRLWRTGYRPTHKTGEPTLFPLAQQLGLVHGATPALAERVAHYQAEAGATQQRTLQTLRDLHHVRWGVQKLRQVTEALAIALEAQRPAVQTAQLLAWLEQAHAGEGRNRPVLSVGRDGVTLGIRCRKGAVWEVASVATVTVLDRRGKRLGSVYLAYAPESEQPTMRRALTDLLKAVLRAWDQELPRLCYVTDAGDNETAYYNNVLRRLRHPRTGEVLTWQRVVDYYHVSERLWRMGEALFGAGRECRSWVRKMQKLLLRRDGVRRVLCSAAALRSRRLLGKKQQKAYRKAYNYLRVRRQYLNYAQYRRVGPPIGSGVTEAACKQVVSQRLKLSGMRWERSGAQTILTLRVVLLSGVWEAAYRRYLESYSPVQVEGKDLLDAPPAPIPA